MSGPLQLSEPLFRWDPGAAKPGVSFDELHQRIVHQQEGGFSTLDILDEGNAPDGLFVRFDQPGLQYARFSPDGLHFAFLCGKKHMGCMETLHPNREPALLTFKWNRSDLEVLDFFWVPPSPQQADSADMVVITTAGLELFQLSFEKHAVKSLRAFAAGVRLSWVEPLSGMALVSTSPRTLQPFDFRAKSPKLSKFDLVLPGDQVIAFKDVAVMPIYDSTYCIHADSANGRVSLRNISNPQQGTPEHDIVIDLSEKSLAGTLHLSNVDNLLIIHCIERKTSLVYDIRHRDGALVTCICGPCSVSCPSGTPPGASWDSWRFFSAATIVDHSLAQVHRLKVSMGAVLEEFLARSPNDLATVMRLLLRRTNCREHIVQMLKRALRQQPSFDEWAQAFAVLNHAYRQSIEAISQKAVPGRQQTVSLQELETVISHQSILSENHMVSLVFHPHFLEVTGQAPHDGSGDPQDRWRIPLPPDQDAGRGGGSTGSRPIRSPYILSIVLSYLRSLLGMQVLPHKILQCFVFDICMFFQQEHTLQQLLHYHVLLDSPELLQRLKEVATTRRRPWATQVCLDMALRIQELSVVADMLLHTKQYLDIVPFVINQRESSFKISRLLEQISEDTASTNEDPELLEHVISEIYAWRAEAEAASSQGGKGGEEVAFPDLEGCERWIPDLAVEAVAAGGEQHG